MKLAGTILFFTFILTTFFSAAVPDEKIFRLADYYGEADEVVSAGSLKNVQLDPIAASPLIVGQRVIGFMVVYKDTSTKRPSDYVEFYDEDGDLVAVKWFDQFGIERIGIDRGLLERTSELQGVFVVFLGGEKV